MGLTVAYISDSKPTRQHAAVRELADALQKKWETKDLEDARKMFGIAAPEDQNPRPVA